MKLKHLATAVILAVLSHTTLHAASYTAEGVNPGDLINSPRFYDNGKGYYWPSGAIYEGIYEEYNNAGKKFTFLGDLQGRVSVDGSTSYSSAYDLYASQWYSNLEDDANTCWYQTASNLIQYWQSYYGVFASNPEELPYGLTYDRSALGNLGGTQSLKVGLLFYDNIINDGSSLRAATDYYFSGGDLSKVPYGYSFYQNEEKEVASIESYTDLKRESSNVPTGATYANNPGGYFSDYFPGPLDVGSSLNNLTAGSIDITSNGASAGDALLTAMGCSVSNSGTIACDTPGQLAYLSLSYGANVGHAITCHGFELNEDGSIKSVLVTNSDDQEFALFTLYVDENRNLYTDEGKTNKWVYAYYNWFINGVEYINTPDELKQMYADYTAQSTNLEWNGAQSTWSETFDSTTEALPTDSTGWEVYVESDTKPDAHSKYYNTYYSETRVVEFGDYGSAGNSVTVDGAVEAAGMVLSASEGKDYSFTGSEENAENSITLTGAIEKTGDSTDTISNLKLLASSVSLTAGELVIAENATIDAQTGSVLSGAAFSIDGGTAMIDSLEVDGGGMFAASSGAVYSGNLTLNQGAELLFDVAGLVMGNAALTFTGDLTLTGTIRLLISGLESVISLNSTDDLATITLIKFESPQDFDVDLIQPAYGSMSYDAATQTLYYTIPEPTTATLSLLALIGLAARRRRK